MVEPVSSSVLVSIVAVKAAEEIGTKIGKVISDRIFGSELSKNQVLLKAIARDVQQILVEVREIHALLSILPDIVDRNFDKRELFKAHLNLKSNIDVYISLPDWNNTLGHGDLVNVLNSWGFIIEREDEVEEIWEIPKYAEFIMLISRGAFKENVLAGLETKIQALNSRKQIVLNDKLTPTIRRLDFIFGSSGFVEKSTFVDSSPWFYYTMKKERTKKEDYCPGDYLSLPPEIRLNIDNKSLDEENLSFRLEDINRNSRACFERDVPDVAWNNQLSRYHNELQAEKSKLADTIAELTTLNATLSLLDVYKEKLLTGIADGLHASDVKISTAPNLFAE